MMRLLLLAFCLVACSDAPRYLLENDARVTLPGAHWQVVNFWAVWCKPCRAEVPELNALAAGLGAADPVRIQVVGVNFDQPGLAQLSEQRDLLGIRFPTLISSPEQLGLPRPAGLPTTYIRDPSGRIVATLAGEQTYASLMSALVSVGALPAQ